MNPRCWLATLAAVILLSAAPLAPAQDETAAVTDRNVEAAIGRGVEWLRSKRNEGGHWDAYPEPGGESKGQYWAGDTALATLALLYAGLDPREDEMVKTLDWLAAQPVTSTYVCAVRAHVFALVSGEKYRKRLDADLDWLLNAVNTTQNDSPGSFGYVSAKQGSGWFDNSNSQFGVLGVWMATEAGESSDQLSRFWKLVEGHWLREQCPDGGWSYHKRSYRTSTGSMTAAGLTSLYVILDRVYGRSGHKKATHVIEAIDRGLDWYTKNFSMENPNGDARWQYYYLYGVERTGRASGRKYFRDRDWFREGARWLLARQLEGGQWQSGLQDTSFALMFLCHGRAPILMNKLEKGDDWDNYLRDVASLTRFSAKNLERLLNWQIVSLDGTMEDLLEAPLLYLSGRGEVRFSEDEQNKLREYAERGGMIVAAAQAGGEEFRKSMAGLAEALFPGLELKRIDAQHPLLSGYVQYTIDAVPEIYEVHNGIRTLMLIIVDDVTASWNLQRTSPAGLRDYHLGVNLYLYATDKTTIPSRLKTPFMALEPTQNVRTAIVGRAAYLGNWKVEPRGWDRFRTYMNNKALTRVEFTDGVSLSDVKALRRQQIVYISGADVLRLSQPEIDGLRAYLTGGGTLLADAVMGRPDFTDSFERLITDLLKVEPERLRENSPILSGKGLPGATNLGITEYRRAARALGRGREFPPLKAFMLGGRPAVIYSPLDISASLLGTQVFDCRGYDEEGALAVLRNMVLFGALTSAEQVRMTPEGTR